MEAIRLFKLLDHNQRNTFLACFLGWALDAFDFFLLTFVIVPMAHDFGTSIADLSYAITITLAMRPVGAFIFGLLGDRFGRRIPLMIDIIFYSLMELLTALSPNYTWLLIFRALYGIGMGGEWGLGASLAMETLPTAARGLFSGILQQGYAFGYLLAAVVYWIVFPLFGWRGLFVAGALPAFLVLYIRARVPESPVWLRQQHAMADFWNEAMLVVKQHWALFVYVIRRRSIILCAAFGTLLIPLWVFSPGFTLLVIGGFAMQFMVQGAWGIVPVHLNELSPGAVRGTFPGFAYQLGNLFAANTAVVEAQLANHFRGASGHPDYAKALALFTFVIFLALILLAAIGSEKRGKEF